MRSNFFVRKADRISDGSHRASPHKSPNCHSLMARSFRFQARLCRLCGCFFISGLYGRERRFSPRVVWRSWYSLYSCACFAYFAWTIFEPFLQKERVATGTQEALRQGKDEITTYMFSLSRAIAATSAWLGILGICLSAPKIADFYKRASDFEEAIGVPHCQCCVPRCFFWSDVQQACICFLYTSAFPLIGHSEVLLQETNLINGDLLKLVLSISSAMIGSFFRFVYRSIYSESLKSASQVLKFYLDVQVRALKHCMNLHSPSAASNHEAFRRVQTIRLNIRTIQKLKEDVNSIWRWPLIMSTLGLLTVSCASLYVCFAGAPWSVRLALSLHATYSAYQCVTLAFMSQSLVNTVKKLKQMCESLRAVDENIRLQVQHLHACVDPEDMSLEGGDFFKINMSLLVSVAAAVIAYGVILLQTSQSMSPSRNHDIQDKA